MHLLLKLSQTAESHANLLMCSKKIVTQLQHEITPMTMFVNAWCLLDDISNCTFSLFVLLFICHCSGWLSDRSKPIIFSMARLDRVKNLTGLVECYAKNSKLRELVNLVVVGGYIDVKKSRDREEMTEIEKMHALMKQYALHGQFRWIPAQMNRARNGELYRYIADTRGVFVQVFDRWLCSKIVCLSYQRYINT